MSPGVVTAHAFCLFSVAIVWVGIFSEFRTEARWIKLEVKRKTVDRDVHEAASYV